MTCPQTRLRLNFPFTKAMKANKGKNGLFLPIFEASATFSSCRVRCGDPNMKIISKTSLEHPKYHWDIISWPYEASSTRKGGSPEKIGRVRTFGGG